jgi:precorrin-6Y C5,15-methyltransferase (decarboxylating)
VKTRRAVTVIGIGDDGCKGLTARAMDAVMSAKVLVGGERQLEFFPQFEGQRIVIKSSLSAVLDQVALLADEQNVCVLASGDPLFFGIGAMVVRKLGMDVVNVVPHPSSIQWAFARVGINHNDATTISLHGRSRSGFVTRLQRLKKVAVLTDSENSPNKLALHMLEYGQHEWKAWVCENLAGPGERVRMFEALEDLAACDDIGPLNVMLLLRSNGEWKAPSGITFLPEEAFAKRMPKLGLITKREVRLISLAALNVRPDSVVWDIGAGSGSVAIEAALLAPEGRVYAIEVDPEGIEICNENIRAFGVDNVHVIAGRAPAICAELESPDAVFVGGSKGSMEGIVQLALDRLTPGGRLVVNAVTLENAGEVYRVLRQRGLTPQVSMVQISRAAPLAHYMRYDALNPIQIFSVEKPAVTAEGSPCN